MRRAGLAVLCLVSACSRCPSGAKPVEPLAQGPSKAWLEGLPLPETGTPADGGTLVVRAMSEPAGLNALEDSSRDAWTLRMTRGLVTEALVELDAETLAVKPQLATGWTESDDHSVTTFTLRDGATFHDGSPFTAKDALATFEAVMDGKHKTASLRAELSGLGAWTAPDEKTLRLSWKTPSPLQLRKLTMVPMLPAASLAADWAELAAHPIGTGPFRFERWERGASVTLARRDGWWGGRPYLDRVVFRVVKDHAVAGGLFERGELDVMTNLQPAAWRAMETIEPKNAWVQRGWRRLRSPDNSYSYIAWNEAVSGLDDARVRRALAHLYPSELVAKVVDLGLELPTTCPFWAGGDSCDRSVKPIAFDARAARAELLDAGYADSDGDGVLDRAGAPLRLRFLMPATSVRLGKLVPLMQEQARAAGVELVPEKVDTAVMTSRVNARDFQVVSRVWTEFDSEVDEYGIFHSSQIDGGSNFVGYASPETDRLLEAIRAEWDPAKRRELERALHRQLFADQPYLFMTVRQSLDAAKVRVHGLRPSLTWYDLRKVWVEP